MFLSCKIKHLPTLCRDVAWRFMLFLYFFTFRLVSVALPIWHKSYTFAAVNHLFHDDLFLCISSLSLRRCSYADAGRR